MKIAVFGGGNGSFAAAGDFARIGLKSRQSFFGHDRIDVEAYRFERLGAFVALLRHFGLARPPELS